MRESRGWLVHGVQWGRWELVDGRWRICGVRWSEEGRWWKQERSGCEEEMGDK